MKDQKHLILSRLETLGLVTSPGSCPKIWSAKKGPDCSVEICGLSRNLLMNKTQHPGRSNALIIAVIGLYLRMKRVE